MSNKDTIYTSTRYAFVETFCCCEAMVPIRLMLDLTHNIQRGREEASKIRLEGEEDGLPVFVWTLGTNCVVCGACEVDA